MPLPASVGDPGRHRLFTHRHFLKGKGKKMARKKTIKSATDNGTRLEMLESLASILAVQIDTMSKDIVDGPKVLPQLSKQYRETIHEIAEIKGTEDNDDEIAEILTARKADGKPNAVR